MTKPGKVTTKKNPASSRSNLVAAKPTGGRGKSSRKKSSSANGQPGKFRIIFFVLFTLFLVFADSWFSSERKVFDFLTLFNSPTEETQQVVLVKIDDTDWADLFEKTSPLKPAKVTELVTAISVGAPRVLGIDILTSDEIHRQYKSPNSLFPIVWAAEAVKEDSRIIEVKPPMGGNKLGDNDISALPESPRDDDGVNRVFRRVIDIEGENLLTFPWRIYELAYPEKAKLKDADTEDYYIRFAKTSRFEIPAREVLNWRNNPSILREHFHDKIVILGGMYGDARDTQRVPYGTLFGVQLNATIVETEIQGDPQKPVSGGWKGLLNIVAFPLFAIVFFHFKFIRGFLITLVIVILVSLAISLFGLAGLSLLIPVFLWTLVLALLDLAMDVYKETGSSLIKRWILK